MDRLTLIIPAKKEKLALPKVLDELTIYNYNSIVVLSPSDVDTIDAIKNYGIVQGIYLGTIRILKCNPFSKSIFFFLFLILI